MLFDVIFSAFDEVILLDDELDDGFFLLK